MLARTESESQGVVSSAKKVLGKLGTPLMGRYLAGRSIVVLCYHRVVDDVGRGMFPELNSARPLDFRAQLDLISDKHEFISETQLLSFMEGNGSLPDRPVLLTFDDGYLDNYENVFPILSERGIPATFFVATQHMDTQTLLWWDRACVLFNATSLDAADLPVLGHRVLTSDGTLVVAREWIEAAKLLPDEERLASLDALAGALSVPAPTQESRVSMNWDQARKMAAGGMSFGGHTHTHPILSRMEDTPARSDIATGVARIRDELGSEVVSFAYPNGGPDDFGSREQAYLRDLGIRIAFTLSSGPTTRDEIDRDPMAIRRIYVGEGDSLERLDLKLHGAGRLRDLVRG